MSDTLVCSLTRDLTPQKRAEALRMCYSVCHTDGHELGFLPRMAYDRRDEWGALLVLIRNDALVGFTMLSEVNAYQELRCLQIWVRADARMILHGRRMIDELNRLAWDRGALILRLWCAVDLEANIFWRILGFRFRGWRWGGAKFGRKHALWMRRVLRPHLTIDSHPRPAATIATSM